MRLDSLASRKQATKTTTTTLFLCCLTASPSQIVILRFCCAKILGYKAHPNFSAISKRGMFVWILSYVPGAIALSLFILKSSNLDKINNAFYPNLSCDNQIIDCLQCETRPCPLRNFRVAKSTSFLFSLVLCTLRFTHMQSLTAYFSSSSPVVVSVRKKLPADKTADRKNL